MKRVLILIAVVGVAALSSGCDITPNAAVVNGAAISQSTVNNELSLASSNANVECYLADTEGSDQPASAGAGDGTVTAAFADEQVTNLIVQQIVQQQLKEHHLTVTTQDLTDATQDIIGQLTSAASDSASSGCGTSGSTILSGLPTEYRDEVVQWQANQEVLTATSDHVNVSNSALEKFYSSNPKDFKEYCLGIVVADSESKATAVHQQLSSGTGFATAAQSSDADTAETPSGGQLGCLSTAQLESELSSLASTITALSVGQITPPEEVQVTNQSTGSPETVWVVLGLNSLQSVPFSQVSSQIREYLLSEKESQAEAEISKLVDKSSVWLDPRYGTWSAKKAITAPLLPPQKSLLSQTADEGLGSVSSSSSSAAAAAAAAAAAGESTGGTSGSAGT